MQYEKIENNFFARRMNEKAEYESQLTDKQIARNNRLSQLAMVMLTGVIFVILEGVFTYAGAWIQRYGAYSVGVRTNFCTLYNYNAYNHLYYTLGLAFFVGLSLLFYYVIFDKQIKKILKVNILYVIPMIVSGIIATWIVWIIVNYSFITYNEFIGAYSFSTEYGPDSMHYLTTSGWPIFLGTFTAAQIVKNIVIAKANVIKQK